MSSIKRFAVIGHPIHHSRSPEIHQAFARSLGFEIQYERIEAPLDGFETCVEQFFNSGGTGLNVTLPFKNQAFNWAQTADQFNAPASIFPPQTTLSQSAQEAKAANTLGIGQQGTAWADNTDGQGFIDSLQEFSIRDKRVLVLGAGGAVAGILGPILREKPKAVYLVNRTLAKAETLAHQFSAFGTIEALNENALQKHDSFDLIIQGTSASFTSDSALDLPACIASNNTLCYDLVYGQETAFLTWAKAQQASTQDGWGMLVCQAARSFERWHGILPEVQFLTQTQ
jgi:shikimate dehydrogenase